IEERHSLFYEPLGSRQTDPALIRQQLSYSAHSATAEMIDIIQDPLSFSQGDEIFHRSDEIFLRQGSLGEVNIDTQLLINLVPADPAKVVFFRIKKQPFQQSTSIRDCWRIARTQPAIDILESF